MTTTATPSTSGQPTPASTAPELQLDLVGMTCASCANRIERGLNKLPGVEATVNYATERATVRLTPDAAAAADARLDPDALVAAVEKAGYRASLVVPRSASAASAAPGSGSAEAGAARNTLSTVAV